MMFTCRFGALALAILLVAGCDSTPRQGPLSTMPAGTSESLLRQQQLRNMQSDQGRAMQNPAVTTVNPGAGGIERAPTGGVGGTGAGVPVDVNPGAAGITRGQGIGAPVR